MIVAYVEPSGESVELAAREIEGAAEALGGHPAGPGDDDLRPLVAVVLPSDAALQPLAGRLALARRVLVRTGTPSSVVEGALREGGLGRSAAFRRLGRPGAPADAVVRDAGRAFVRGGGSIDLEHPEVRFWLHRDRGDREVILQETGTVDRSQAASRAMPRLPFRRPVSLPPRLARAATNLAAVRPGDRVLDPFLGTGALLAEAALLGARTFGLDADPAMVRGALRNLAALGVTAEAIVEGDARSAEFPGVDPGPFDAIVTDPPYGRSSASVGGEPGALVPEVLGRWQSAVRPEGRIVVLGPGGPPYLGPPWREDCRIPVRVHRSLTREFRRYRRSS